MRYREDVIETFINGKQNSRFILDKEYPTAASYIENRDFMKEQAKGLTEEQAQIESVKRRAIGYLDAGFYSLEELEKLSPEAADDLREQYCLLSEYYEDPDSISLGNGVYCTPNALDALKADTLDAAALAAGPDLQPVLPISERPGAAAPDQTAAQ